MLSVYPVHILLNDMLANNYVYKVDGVLYAPPRHIWRALKSLKARTLAIMQSIRIRSMHFLYYEKNNVFYSYFVLRGAHKKKIRAAARIWLFCAAASVCKRRVVWTRCRADRGDSHTVRAWIWIHRRKLKCAGSQRVSS